MTLAKADAATISRAGSKGLVVRASLGILGLIASGALLSWILQDELAALGKFFIERFGALGMGLLVVLAESSPLPIPQTPALVLGLAGGLPIAVALAFAVGGSLVGDTLSFCGGRILRATHLTARVLGPRSGTLEELTRRYGVWAIAVAAVAPIPFGPCAWSAGALNLRWPVFGMGLVCRVLKVSFNVSLVGAGWWLGTGHAIL